MFDPIVLATAYRLNGSIFQASAKKLARGLKLREDGLPAKYDAVPLYYLASQAAELYLKAGLLKREISEESLKKFDYRHNLEKLLYELQNKGVKVTPQTVNIVIGLSKQHKNHTLRYNSMVELKEKLYWPPLTAVFEALDELMLLTRISTQGI